VEIIPMITWDNIQSFEFVHGIDNIIKTTTALLGLIYFSIEIPNKIRRARLERKILEEDLRKKKFDNDQVQGEKRKKKRNIKNDKKDENK